MFRLRISRFVCIFLVGLILASCGSPGTISSTNSMTLKVASVTNSISFFPVYVAEQEHFFKAQGLTLDPDPLPQLGSGSKLATAVEAGSIDVGVGGITDTFTISRIDAHIRIVGAVVNDFLVDVVVSKNFELQAHLTSTSSLTDKVHALRGKKVGISAPNSASDTLLTYLFRQQGLDAQKDVVKISIGATIATQLATLQAGRIDAAVVTAPGGELAEAKGIGDIFISPVRGDDQSLVGELFEVAFTKQQVIDSKPDAMRAFIRGLAQAEAFTQKNPDKTEDLLVKFLKVDKKTAITIWNTTKSSMPLTPQVDQKAYDVASQFHIKAGLIKTAFPYKDLVATDTINKDLSGFSA